jgi:hypothetical protein
MSKSKILIDDRRVISDRRVAGEILLFCDFTNPLASYGFTEQALHPGRATLVTIAGRTAVRLHTEPGDNNVNGSGTWERNDLQLGLTFNEGDRIKVKHSILFPDDYFDPPESVGAAWNAGVVADFHNTTPGGGQANFMVLADPVLATSQDRPTGLSFLLESGDQNNPVPHPYPIGPIIRNIWYDFDYDILFASGPNGFFNASVNGVRKMSYTGQTLYPGQGVYMKLANYHSPFGKASSVCHSEVIISKV